jgi:hypothetical protein
MLRVTVEDDGLSVDDHRCRSKCLGRICDGGEAVGPIVAAPLVTIQTPSGVM